MLLRNIFVYGSLFQSAQAICKLSEVLGESLSSHHHVLLKSVMKEVPGRLWEVGRILYGLTLEHNTPSELQRWFILCY